MFARNYTFGYVLKRMQEHRLSQHAAKADAARCVSLRSIMRLATQHNASEHPSEWGSFSYSASTLNSAPDAKSAPFWLDSAVKRR